MKLDMNIPEHASLIARYLSNELTVNERADFENMLEHKPENKPLVNEMKKYWEAASVNQQPDTEKAWDKLKYRLQADNLFIDEKVSKKHRFISRTWMRVAAIALILIAVGSLLYVGLNRKPSVQMANIETGADAKTRIKTLADGSIIYLAKNTSFSYPEQFTTEARQVELKGEAFFDIAHDASKPFIIETQQAEIQVLGTAFNVRTVINNGFELMVERGKVKVTSKANPEVFTYVKAGEKLSVAGAKLEKTVSGYDFNRAWFKNNMHFKDETLQNIITVLNRNFNADFKIANGQIGQRRLTVTFSDQSVATMTELICLTLNLQSKQTDGAIVFSETNGGTQQP